MSSRKHKHRGHRNSRRHHRGATAAPAAAPQMGVASFFASILQCGALDSPCAGEEDYYSSQDDDSSYEELEERPSRRGRSPRQRRGTNSRRNGADDETADLTAKRGNLTEHEHTTTRRSTQKTKRNKGKSSQRHSSLYDFSSDEENQDSGSVCSSNDSEIDYAPIVKSGVTKSTSQSLSPSSSSDISFNQGADFGFVTEKNDLNLHPTSGNCPRGGDIGHFHDAGSDSDASDMSLNTLLTRQLQLSSQQIANLRTNPGLDHTHYGLDQHGQYNTYDQHLEAATLSPRPMRDNFKTYVPPDHLNIVQIEVPPGDIGINLQSTPEGPVVTEVSPYSVASQLCVGDKIIALDGVCVDRFPGRAVMEILQARGRSVRIIKYVPAVPIKSSAKKKKKNKWMNSVIKKRSDALSNEKRSNKQSDKKKEMKRNIKNLQIHTGASQMY